MIYIIEISPNLQIGKYLFLILKGDVFTDEKHGNVTDLKSFH